MSRIAKLVGDRERNARQEKMQQGSGMSGRQQQIGANQSQKTGDRCKVEQRYHRGPPYINPTINTGAPRDDTFKKKLGFALGWAARVQIACIERAALSPREEPTKSRVPGNDRGLLKKRRKLAH